MYFLSKLTIFFIYYSFGSFMHLLFCPIAISSCGADNQISSSVSVYVSVCMFMDTPIRSHFSTNLHKIWPGPLGSEKEELIRLRSKSENAFP